MTAGRWRETWGERRAWSKEGHQESENRKRGEGGEWASGTKSDHCRAVQEGKGCRGEAEPLRQVISRRIEMRI